MLAIAVLPASLMITFGHIARRPRTGWVLLMVMVALFLVGLEVCDRAETAPPPQFVGLHISGGNMEGKEVRFGIGDSVLTAVVTANTSTGSYNSIHDSYQPLGVLVPLVCMLLGEVVFGGLGTGVYSIVMPALVGVFLGGLMIGRMPEFLGKKITSAETRWIALYALLSSMVVLVLTGIAVITNVGRAGLVTNSGPRGFIEILFAYASCMANNGQTMAGLNVNSVFYNVATTIAMLAGRYGLAALALALAGRLAARRRLPSTAGTVPDNTPTFGALVFGTILLGGALSFLPALALAPIVEFLRH
jgi:K+-transporting ATPase ATPase A chain